MKDEEVSENGFENSLQSAAAAVARASSAKEQRIAELRRLYQSGEYKVDASATAARIIDEHLPEESS
jgi:anti-sigma28 factor (negative regulator of flagellin synthesis)